jgi:hypothetical protein
METAILFLLVGRADPRDGLLRVEIGPTCWGGGICAQIRTVSNRG